MLTPEAIKAMEFLAYLAYNKGKSDQKRGNEGPEKFEDFLKQRIEDAKRLCGEL